MDDLLILIRIWLLITSIFILPLGLSLFKGERLVKSGRISNFGKAVIDCILGYFAFVPTILTTASIISLPPNPLAYISPTIIALNFLGLPFENFMILFNGLFFINIVAILQSQTVISARYFILGIVYTGIASVICVFHLENARDEDRRKAEDWYDYFSESSFFMVLYIAIFPTTNKFRNLFH